MTALDPTGRARRAGGYPELHLLLELLESVMTAKGAAKWLDLRREALGGERALDLLKRGEVARVIELARELGAHIEPRAAADRPDR